MTDESMSDKIRARLSQQLRLGAYLLKLSLAARIWCQTPTTKWDSNRPQTPFSGKG